LQASQQSTTAAPTSEGQAPSSSTSRNKGKRKAPTEGQAQADKYKRVSNNSTGNTIDVHGFDSSNVTVNVSSGSGFGQSTSNTARGYMPRKKHARIRKLLGFKR